VEQEIVANFKTMCELFRKKPVFFPLCKLQVPPRLPKTLITCHDVIKKALMFAQLYFGLLNVK
jgi:hypothetical protein